MPKSLDLLTEAQKNLTLQTIHLVASNLTVKDNYNPRADNPSLMLQFRQGLKSLFLISDKEGEDLKQHPEKAIGVRFVYEFGIRLVKEDNADDEYAKIEADYAIGYNLKAPTSIEALTEFGERNAPYQLWSFWREHVFSNFSKAGFEQVVLPMYFHSPKKEDTK